MQQEQTYCARCLALRTENNKCPNCQLGHKTFNRYCRKCMYVHLNSIANCKAWKPQEN